MSLADRTPASKRVRYLISATLSVVTILLSISALSAHVVTTMRDAANEIDADRSQRAVEAAVFSLQKRLAATVRDNAVWDEAYAAIMAGNAGNWIYESWGSTSADYALYDGVIVLDRNGRQVEAYRKGVLFDAVPVFGAALVRQSLAASKAPSTNAQVSFFLLSGRVTMVATLAFQPFQTVADVHNLYTLTFFKELSPAFVEGVASEFGIEGLRLSNEVNPGYLTYKLEDGSGDSIGYLNWPRTNPGNVVYDNQLPKLAILAALFGLFLGVALLFFRAEFRREKARAAEATHNALHDHLTGLLNRQGLIQAISNAPAGSAIHLIDLDGFKAVNDAWGHAVGDQLICLVAERLRTLPDVAAIARMGGDEFALIQHLAAEATTLGTAILQRLQMPFHIDGRTVEVGASVGITTRSPEIAPLEIIRRADMALYCAKENGRGQIVCYAAALDSEREKLLDAEFRLKNAIANDEIAIAFQPLVSTIDGRIAGVEALARWSPPTGPVSPEFFIPLAERSGLIDALSQKILKGAIRAVCAWPDLDLSVNVSPLQLCNPHFADEIEKMLKEEKFPPTRLILEVTEGVFISKPDRARRSFTALRALGIRFAMDDFGTGHASVGALREFGFDKLKIDRSLLEEGNDAVFKATIQLASALQIPVTAEGIETEEQAQFARQAGCELLQGYLLGRPMSIDQLRQRLEPAAHQSGDWQRKLRLIH